MLNLLSLLLGLLSWGLGAAAVPKGRDCRLRSASLLACAAALLLQLGQIHRLVQLGDWTALMDTMDAVLLAAGVLLAVTAALNLPALFRRN